MFRRRPIRRMLRQGRRLARAARHAPEELIFANEMMESGDYASAAEQFETLARIDRARGGRYAPQLFLQAGRAGILAGHIETGLAHLKQGLALLAERGDWLRLNRAGRRTIGELSQRGLSAEADEISHYLNMSLPGSVSLPREPVIARRAVLPTHCPSCGAALRPDEVDWLDEITAECAYCGSPVREDV